MNARVPDLSRRHFIVGTTAVSSGLALGLQMSFMGSAEAAQAAAATPEIGAWVVIKPDDTVIVRVVRSEMGQGTITGLAQMVAEELECDWKKVTVEYPTPGESLKRKRVWGDFSTGGSRGIRTSEQYVRKGGAAARLMLVQAAANEWKVPVAECVAAQSVITHTPTGRKVTFGKVAAAASKIAVPTDITLKDPKDWKIIGQSLNRIDTFADKVTGKQVYGLDLKLPGMLVATIKECPVFGGKLKSFDASKVTGMKGVKKVLQVGDTAVAVVADTFWVAKTALDQVQIVWDEGPNASVSSASIAKTLEEGLTAEQAFVGNTRGDTKAALTAAVNKTEATYFYPYLNHATMEPMNATAKWTPERCEAWVPTQDGEASLAAVIAASGLAAVATVNEHGDRFGLYGLQGAHHLFLLDRCSVHIVFINPIGQEIQTLAIFAGIAVTAEKNIHIGFPLFDFQRQPVLESLQNLHIVCAIVNQQFDVFWLDAQSSACIVIKIFGVIFGVISLCNAFVFFNANNDGHSISHRLLFDIGRIELSKDSF